MSTRGLIGFKKNGAMKAAYNHFDSYPECLGASVLESIRGISIDKLCATFDDIKFVEEIPPGVDDEPEARKGLGPWLDGTFVYMANSNEFFNDPLFCEWSYFVNLDTKTLEVYKGRFHGHRQELVGEFPLSDLPDEKTFVKMVNEKVNCKE